MQSADEIAQHEYAIPVGHDLNELTGILFTYLGDPDPGLRDEIAYTVYANWLKQKRYPPETLREHIARLLANLESGIGETESDSVFLRTFSVLFLAEIVHNDNKSPLLEVMMLADNEGWVMFEPEVRREQRNETLDVYRAIAALITR